jgi:hypothetical protein
VLALRAVLEAPRRQIGGAHLGEQRAGAPRVLAGQPAALESDAAERAGARDVGAVCTPLSARAAPVSTNPIRSRRARMSTPPSRCPSTATEPLVGCAIAAARRSSVVLPAPLGPRIA